MLLTGARVTGATPGHSGVGGSGTVGVGGESAVPPRLDVRVTGSRIAEVAPPGALSAADGEEVVDLAGYVLLPAPAEPHAHLDKALTVDAAVNPTGDLFGAITAWMAHLDKISHADMVDRAVAAAETVLAHGATAIRTHVHIGDQLGLLGLGAMFEVRERLRPAMDVQIVAMPGKPLTGVAGADNRAVLRDAVAAGADLVGGAPYIDPDPMAAVQVCLDAAAAATGIGVDLHMDETLDPALCHLDALAERAKGIGIPVTASHCVSLSVQPLARQELIAAALAEAGVAVVTLPQTNLYLQARGVATAPPRGLTPLRVLLDSGVTVAGGGDNLRDPFNPVGRGDPLETASLLVTAGHLGVGESLAAVGRAARRVMGLGGGTLAPGEPAELLAVRGTSLTDVVGGADEERMVWHAGRLVADTRVTRSIYLDESRLRAGH